MKKVLFMIFAAMTVMACSDDSTPGVEPGGGSQAKTEPATEVYIQGSKVAATRVAEVPTNRAHFFIRVDNRIPGIGNFDSKEYFPQTETGKSVMVAANEGTVDVYYPSWDNSSTNPWYVFDTKGVATLKALDKLPTVEDLIKADKSKGKINFKGVDLKKLHVLWYIVKYQNVDYQWHVDGVLTDKDVKDVTDIPGIGEDIKKENKDLEDKRDESTVPATGNGNVEVDIHQQAHKDWSEIKTSIHVRDEAAKKVIVEIPLAKENVAEQDDFAIRTWDLKIDAKVYINGTEYEFGTRNPVMVTIEHQATKVVITADCTAATEYIQMLRKEYGDGVTVEVHTYGKGLTDAQLWEKLKKATVRVEPSGYKFLKYNGATSAYFSK